MRFHLVDRAEEVCYDKYIIGVKCVSMADDIFNEHFPSYPIFPGSLILEGLAQLAGSFFEIIMDRRNIKNKRSVLTIVNKMKFRKTVGPGDKMYYRADVKTLNEEYGVAIVKAELDGEICAEGELLFNFFDIPNERLQKSREEIYAICMRNAKEVVCDN